MNIKLLKNNKNGIFKKKIKQVFSSEFRYRIRVVQKKVVYFFRRQVIRWPVVRGIPVKIILGAAMTSQFGWYSTNQEWLDISNPKDWMKVFKGKRLLTNVLAEHVFEHLSAREMQTTLGLIYSHLVFGGRVRIAVPDGYNPDPLYIKNVGINGIGADAAEHKQLLNVDVLSQYMKEAGFSVKHVEGYRRDGCLVANYLDPTLGLVKRSRQNLEPQPIQFDWNFPDANTSLIVDGIKTE